MRPLSGSIAPRSVEALSTDVESPRVVLGVPPSSAPSRPPETLESETPPSVSTKANVDVTVDVVIPKLAPVTVVEPTESPREESPREAFPPPAPIEAAVSAPAEPAETSAAEATAPQAALTEATAEAVATTNPDLTAPPPPVAASAQEPALAKQDEEEPAPDTQRSLAPQVVETPAEAAPSSLEAASVEAASVEAAGAEPSIDPDDVSVPPIGDIAVEKFFSDGDLSARHGFDANEGDSLTEPDKAVRKSLPHVVERRERLSRYVKWAVAGAAIVCLAAVGRTAFTSGASAHHASAVAAAKAAPPPAAVEIPEPPVTKAAATEAAPAPQPVATDDQPAAAAPDPESAEGATGDAKEEKETARKALEHRKIADAIEAAERSVKLDASDAEAWLILGAAYLEKGNTVEARKAFASCVSDAKTGPRQECAKMLH